MDCDAAACAGGETAGTSPHRHLASAHLASAHLASHLASGGQMTRLVSAEPSPISTLDVVTERSYALQVRVTWDFQRSG
ncbi:MAG: hypothetical protein WAM82_03685 [Thermoanaerobaculia bacterium]